MNLAHNIGDDSTDEEQGILELETLKAECEAFAADGGMPRPTMVPPLPPTPPDIHYTVPDPLDIQRRLQEIGGHIGADLPEGWGFNLLLFEYGVGGSLFYISSAERADVIAVMREYIRRQTQ